MNIGLVGYFGAGNYGDELFIEAFRRSFPGHQLTVLHASDTTGRHHPETVAGQDAIIIGGGDLVITDSYTNRYWDPILLSRPVHVIGIGVDFERRPDPGVVEALASFFGHENVRSVGTRDVRSRRWIAEHLQPRRAPRVHADLVAALPFSRLPSADPTLGLVLRAHAPIDLDDVRALTENAHTNGWKVKPIVLGTGFTARQDTEIVEQVLGKRDRPVIVSSIGEVTAEVARCDLVVSQRFHGCLVPMLMGIPTAGLMSTQKFSALFEEVDRIDALLEAGDPRVGRLVDDPPAPVSPKTIAGIRGSARSALQALAQAITSGSPFVDDATGQTRLPPGYPYRDAFLDGEVDRSARWSELSPRLKSDPGAALDPRAELRWYRSQILDRKGRTYLATLGRLIDWTPALRELRSGTRSIVAIPVAGTEEHDHIYGTLSLYAQQDPASLANTVVLLYLNYPADAVNDPARAGNVDMTRHQIESARRDFSQLELAVVEEPFDPELPRLHRGIVGFIGRRMYDLAMMSVERAQSEGRLETHSDVLLIRNDADAVGMSRRYLERLIRAAERNPESDVFQGTLRWGTHRYRDYPGFGVVMTFKEALRALALRPGVAYAARAGTNGSNVAIRMASLAAVGGVGNSAYYGAGGDDVEIGHRIHAARLREGARRGLRPIRYVPDAQIDASGERILRTYRSGRSIIEAWDTYNRGPGGYTPRNHIDERELIGPERFDDEVVLERIERNVNDLTQAWFTDPGLVDIALRCVIGSRDAEGRPVYSLSHTGGRTTVRFTDAGREWISRRLVETRYGRSEPYGRRLRRALYGEAHQTRSALPRMVSAV